MNTAGSERHKVYLIDGSGYIFRAFYAIMHLSTKEGFPTNALFGFTRMLVKLLEQAQVNHVALVFDAGRETFRNELYSEYKANREECPEDLVPQMPYFRDLGKALGFPIMELPGYEADDVIGTLAARLEDLNCEVVIVSGDKDLTQLVNDETTIWDTMRDVRYGPQEVKEKFGVPPEKIVDFLGLTGDSSDNIPGLQGVGPKTAVQLIEKYGDVESIISKASEIRDTKGIRNRKKISDQIETDPEIIKLSKKLAEICLTAPVVLDTEQGLTTLEGLSDEELFKALSLRAPHEEELTNLCRKFEFESLLEEFKLASSRQDNQSKDKAEYITVLKDDFKGFVEELSKQQIFCFDLETTSLDPHEAKIVGLAFAWTAEKGYYIPVAHKEGASQVSLDEALQVLKPLLEDPKVGLVGQNLKYDISILAENGVEAKGIVSDTMIASYLLNPDRSSHKLSSLAKDHLAYLMLEYEQVVGELNDFSEVAVNEATKYAAEDAQITWKLHELLSPKIASSKVDKVYNEIELPLIPVLSRMERKGIKLDVPFLEKMSAEFELELNELTGKLYELAGCEFNLNSPKQLQDVLFNRLELPTKGLKKTKTGISTNQAVLEKLSDIHPLPKLLLRYRLLFKLKSTYVDALPAQVSTVTKRLHTKFNQAVTGTGRLSSSDPNLQNIPIQTEEGRRIRKAFVAEPGMKLISADYSQIELRLLAHMSADENLICAFKNGDDIHANTAREILELDEHEEVSPEVRRIGKTMNFGIIYGMSGFRLARELGIPVAVANEYIEEYFNKFSGVKKFFNDLEKQAQENKYVSTMFGRRRYLTGLETSGRDAGFLMRVAINAPVQGSAADLIKLAMIKIDQKIQQDSLPLSMLLQIHDELVFEASEDAFEEMSNFVVKEMEQVQKLSVPLKVDVGGGSNWGQAH